MTPSYSTPIPDELNFIQKLGYGIDVLQETIRYIPVLGAFIEVDSSTSIHFLV